MNIVFRVDATKNIGLGHIMRCYALAEEFVKKKNKCYFLSNIDNEIIYEKINKLNIKIMNIYTSPKLKKDLKYLIDFSKNNNVDWVLTDHYDIDSDYIKEIKNNGFKVLSVDDTSQIYYPSDIVLNQNIGSEKLNFNTNKDTKLLLGPKYVMLRDELLIRERKKFKNNVEKILVTLGGVGYSNLIDKIPKNLKEIIDKNIEIIVIFPSLNNINEKFHLKINKFNNSNFRIVFSPENMADLYLESDIAISAGGISCYELAYFGIPNLIISIAENQLNIAKELNEKNVSVYLGKEEEFDFNIIKENILKLINDNSLRRKMSKNGIKLVDGKGKKRIIEVMNKF